MSSGSFTDRVRAQRPLVHCITNIVVANFQANGLLALGASPVMADSPEEVGEMARAASCTVLNIGTLHSDSLHSMELAGKAAAGAGRPVVLDPVGAGATSFRREAVRRILGNLDVTLIRCNAGELAAIAAEDWQASGVDAGSGKMDVRAVAERTAREHGCLVAVTGKVDYVTDGMKTFRIEGGHELLSRVTGTGCLLSAVCGAFIAAAGDSKLEAVAEALKFYKTAGELAAAGVQGPGTFGTAFIDQLYLLEGVEAAAVAETREVRA
ncbi:hydroxyethylthiazole kinase [Bhargavaea ullalensis]|uniref:Hydroxyethylthiazole kinase n=1 Tax=Bhargavaea ullalensis TaxID=1265685 RepID=A0ABV2G7N4_9BACL